MVSEPKPYLTLEQYLEIEADEADGCRAEYENGEIVPLEAASRNHGTLTINLAAVFHGALKTRPTCRAYSQNLLVQAGSNQTCYPDLFVVCGEDKLRPGRNDVIVNPRLIVEVLSPRTEKRVPA